MSASTLKRAVLRLSQHPMLAEKLDDLDHFIKTTSEQVSDEAALVSTMAAKVTMPELSTSPVLS